MMASTSEAPPSSSSETPTINNSTKTRSNFSIRDLIAKFKAHFCVSELNPLENNRHNSASSSATTIKDDDRGGALSSYSEMIRNDLLLVDSALKEYIDHMKEQINHAHEKFEELQLIGSSKRDLGELQKVITKLKSKIPSHNKIRSADSNKRPKRWPNINEAKDGMTDFFYHESKPTHTSDFDGLLKAFHDLPWPLPGCLLCFFKFPPAEIIKRTTMIYLWIGQGYFPRHQWWPTEEDSGIKVFDELIAKGFIEPIYENCSLVPDSCRMSLSVRSSLYELAEHRGFTSNGTHYLDLGFDCRDLYGYGHSCLINVGEAIIDNCGPEIFEKHIRSLYLGRWQSSATHHIEVADTNKILHGLKKMDNLRLVSLQGISMITELPKGIFRHMFLKILDLRACHNLEAIPDDIGLLSSLTHLDMSECYFLEHIPKSLSQLSNLEVLKGFVIRDIKNNKQPCTLRDLSKLSNLRKLNIYVSVKDFYRLWDFDDLEKLKGLQKLTISWGGCSLQGESLRLRKILENPSHATGIAFSTGRARGPLTLPPRLQKLDLQCFPAVSLTDWLKPVEIKGLKKLYIRGGQLCDLGQFCKSPGEQWTVEILRLKYLSELVIDWRELRILFPELIYLHQVECPKLTNFQCDERGVWMEKKAIDTHEQLQKYFRTCGMISSSSTPMLDQDDPADSCPDDDCEICPVDDI